MLLGNTSHSLEHHFNSHDNKTVLLQLPATMLVMPGDIPMSAVRSKVMELLSTSKDSSPALLSSRLLPSPGPKLTCKGWCCAGVALWLLQLLLHLAGICLILPQHSAAFLQAPQGLEGLQLALQNLFSPAHVGWELHGQEHQGLCQVVLQHIPDDSVLLVEAGAA